MSFSLDLSDLNGGQDQSPNTDPNVPDLNFLNFVGQYGSTGHSDFRDDLYKPEMKAALNKGFIYDSDGYRITDIDRLRSLVGPDGREMPILYFRDPNNPSGNLHYMKTDGYISESRSINQLVSGNYDIRMEQATSPHYAKPMSFGEKLLRFFSFGLWKPERFHQKERRDAVRYVERLKKAEAMGYLIDPQTKKKYENIWELTDDAKSLYIEGKPLQKKTLSVNEVKSPQPEQTEVEQTVTEEVDVESTGTQKQLPVTEDQLERLRKEAKMAYDRIDKLEDGHMYSEGLAVIKGYLKQCQEHPRPAQCTAVNKLMISGDEVLHLADVLEEKENIGKITNDQLETLLNVEDAGLLNIGYALSKNLKAREGRRQLFLKQCGKGSAAEKIILKHHGLIPPDPQDKQPVAQNVNEIVH